jgi:hypothetical protein
MVDLTGRRRRRCSWRDRTRNADARRSARRLKTAGTTHTQIDRYSQLTTQQPRGGRSLAPQTISRPHAGETTDSQVYEAISLQGPECRNFEAQ